MKYYKVLNDHKSCSGGTFDWSDYLPHDGKPGAWTRVIKKTSMCQNGYHGTDAMHIINFLDGNELWEVEAIEPLWDETKRKFCTQSMRLIRRIETYNDNTLRLFACWCMRQIWHLLTDEYSRTVVEVAERYANGEATQEELSAAWDASGASVTAYDAARYAAWAAARNAVYDAARYAASGASGAVYDAARYAQSKKLIEMLGLKE